MADATIESAPSDFAEAKRRLSQAVNHTKSADNSEDNESAFILLYAAVHKSLSAVLLAAGLRVSSGERAHVMLIREARNHLPSDHAQLLSRIDRARRKRNNVAYETETIASSELEAMKRDARKTLEEALKFVLEKEKQEGEQETQDT